MTVSITVSTVVLIARASRGIPNNARSKMVHANALLDGQVNPVRKVFTFVTFNQSNHSSYCIVNELF